MIFLRLVSLCAAITWIKIIIFYSTLMSPTNNACIWNNSYVSPLNVNRLYTTGCQNIQGSNFFSSHPTQYSTWKLSYSAISPKNINLVYQNILEDAVDLCLKIFTECKKICMARCFLYFLGQFFNPHMECYLTWGY